LLYSGPIELAAGAVVSHFSENRILYFVGNVLPFLWMVVFGTVALNLNMRRCQEIALNGGLLNSRETGNVISLSHEHYGGKGGPLFGFGSVILRRNSAQGRRGQSLES
jgi:hypothetical protein